MLLTKQSDDASEAEREGNHRLAVKGKPITILYGSSTSLNKMLTGGIHSGVFPKGNPKLRRYDKTGGTRLSGKAPRQEKATPAVWTQ